MIAGLLSLLFGKKNSTRRPQPAKALFISPADVPASPFNPIEGMSAAELTQHLQLACQNPEDSAADVAEIEDQIEALAPALIELRDRAGVKLSMRLVGGYATIAGFAELAQDTRLSPLSRMKCRAIHTRMVVQGVKAYLGNRNV